MRGTPEEPARGEREGSAKPKREACRDTRECERESDTEDGGEKTGEKPRGGGVNSRGQEWEKARKKGEEATARKMEGA